MKILLIGGPRFIGLHLVENALAAGHEVTIFNRGTTNPDLYPQLERLRGDRTRDEDLRQLAGREWDAVMDTCGFDVRVVQKTLDVLKGNIGHYTFVSSIGYYADFREPWDESGPPAPLLGDPDVPLERSYGGSAHYGPMKALCEEAVANAFPSYVAIRLTVGVGPTLDGGTSAWQMNYWAGRVRDYDEVLVPGPANRLVNFIDVRDMTAFMIQAAERGLVGAFNLAEPALPVSDMLALFKGIYGSTAELVFVDPDWLLTQGVKPNRELPWWVPGESQRYQFAVDGNKALRNGLTLRPFQDSIRDSVAEDPEPPGGRQRATAQGEALRALSLSREREVELLEQWRAR
jgi:2'-hydroxyisoflavone reductase